MLTISIIEETVSQCLPCEYMANWRTSIENVHDKNRGLNLGMEFQVLHFTGRWGVWGIGAFLTFSTFVTFSYVCRKTAFLGSYRIGD